MLIVRITASSDSVSASISGVTVTSASVAASGKVTAAGKAS